MRLEPLFLRGNIEMKLLQVDGFSAHCGSRFGMGSNTMAKKKGQGKRVRDRETFRLEPDVVELFQEAVDQTGEDKGRILNEAIRVNVVEVVAKILKETADRDAHVAEKVKKMRGQKDKEQ